MGAHAVGVRLVLVLPGEEVQLPAAPHPLGSPAAPAVLALCERRLAS